MDSNRNLANGLGIAAFSVAVLSLIFSFIPCIGMYAAVPAFLALITGIIAFVKARETDLNKGLIIAAIVISVFGLAIGGWQYTAWNKTVNNVMDISDKIKEAADSLKNVGIIDPDDIIDDELEMMMDSLHTGSNDIRNALDSMDNE